MNYTEKYALKIGEKVLRDIKFWDDDIETPTAKYIKKGLTLVFPENAWLVSFPYGKEDYGTDINDRSRATIHVTIFDDDGIATSISYKNGYIKLGYNTGEENYYVKEQRP
ncbi:hypothetical protein SAMN04489761_2951 [Tenacibaculum sp. MAR_2009_124]|uniref:hypothetical protein n=1 Tax=Tenacibaculum sp. MAR_2009_124 TaxID=1250059 RepID=UPI00089ABA26|nr:hypothetical protein [Tenacibaculum sp. MAR_2009_124]SEC42306.1 hypothetical protein SAMN04489761_2951 [Tenacibaculum sp. MAR_2009_124]